MAKSYAMREHDLQSGFFQRSKEEMKTRGQGRREWRDCFEGARGYPANVQFMQLLERKPQLLQSASSLEVHYQNCMPLAVTHKD